MQLKLAPKRLASCLRRLRQFLRSHVVRRRVDEIAGKHRRFRHPRDVGDVDAVGRHQFDVGRIRLAVAAEAVAAERKGERCKPGVVRRIGEAVDAWRQQAGQRAGPEQVAGFGAFLLEAEHDLRDLAIGRRQDQACPGFAAKSLASANCRAGAARPSRIACHLVLVANVIGMAGAAGAVSNTDCMRLSVLSEVGRPIAPFPGF